MKPGDLCTIESTTGFTSVLQYDTPLRKALNKQNCSRLPFKNRLVIFLDEIPESFETFHCYKVITEKGLGWLVAIHVNINSIMQ